MGAEVSLTRRAREVAELVALGLTNREIASRLFLSERTIEWHVEQIMNKLAFTSRSQIAAWVGRSQLDMPVAQPGSERSGYLPASITSFVGRDRELQSLIDFVPSNRLVTVTGAGGTGKTRLALRLAEKLESAFANGAWLCDLAPVASPGLIVDAVAQALGVRSSGSDLSEALRAHLRNRQVLLIFDNCEHVAAASAALAQDLLRTCSGVRILATSRIPLGVIGEALWQLDPLPHQDAVRLFDERAASAAPEFRLAPRPTEAIDAICRGLDGVPLAIELVVPRLRVQSAHDVAAAVLDPAWQAESADRHGSLHSVINWSYQLMPPSEQALFNGLGLFSGWFDAADATAIAAAPEVNVPVLLASIAEQSMVIQEHTVKGIRYRLLEILKAFALSRLDVTGKMESTRVLHTDRMIELGPRLDVIPRWEPSLQAKVRSTMMDDVRAALGHLLRTDPRRAAWFNAGMMSNWTYTGRVREGIHWSNLVLEAHREPSTERCWSLFMHARGLGELGRLDEATKYVQMAEEYVDTTGNEELRSQTLIVRAICLGMIGKLDSAVEIGAEAIAEMERRGDEVALAYALNHNGWDLLYSGRPLEAASRARRALEIQRRLAPDRIAFTLDTVAQANVMVGELDEARDCWLEVLERSIGGGEAAVIPTAVFGLALVSGLQGRREEALTLYFLGDRLQMENGTPYADPITPMVTEAFERLQSEIAPTWLEQLRSESAVLTPENVLFTLR